jgi:5-formyltetrahydrofolate cyclo-ligase
MEEIREKKREIREEITRKLAAFPPEFMAEKVQAIENRLFEFANFLESRIVLLYTPLKNEVDTTGINQRSFMYNKIVVLPSFNPDTYKTRLYKVDNLEKNLVSSPRGNLEPDTKVCKSVPLDCLDLAIIPGVAMDEKGGRIGSGMGYYDRLIPDLPVTTRKVGLVFEDQILPVIPMESHDKHLDIIITEERIIYKI